MFICGRGFVWSRRDPDADADKLNSIHSKSSNSIFQASPLVLAALHFNLNIAQILDFNFELDNFRKKFCEENLNAVLSEKFTKVSNVIKFAQLLNLENLASNDSLRSLVNEYLSKPHVCNIRSVLLMANLILIQSPRKQFQNMDQTKLKVKKWKGVKIVILKMASEG